MPASSVPYLLISDLHMHEWSAFSTINENGVNSRLWSIRENIRLACRELIDRGGRDVVIGGDIFHVRGSVSPMVLNVTLDLFAELKTQFDLNIYAIPGNHDLETNDTFRLSNSAEALTRVGVTMVNDPAGNSFKLDCDQNVALFPWHGSHQQLMKTMQEWLQGLSERGGDCAQVDAVIHAPVNGVIKGLPDSGLEADELAALGFKRVFAGHYHNHVDFGNGVYSIGAVTHQTWNDPNTKAGHLLVYPEKVEWRCTQAPQFVDITVDTDPNDIELMVDGHFVRVKVEIENESDVETVRNQLKEAGALGVTVIPIRKAAATRSAAVTAGKTLRGSTAAYIDEKGYDDPEAVKTVCDDILTTVEAVE
tara:strand:+ start:4174 stop:5265 length:1092 start_codon:yes stop_codon:yes gene_type:complete